jgi:hypothetical protein
MPSNTGPKPNLRGLGGMTMLEMISDRIRRSVERNEKKQDSLLQILRNSPLVRGPMGVATAAGGAATAMAMRGFSGTVEMNRLNLEMLMVSRELAGSFRPAIEFATKALMQFRKFLEKFGESGQNAIMLGGLALGGLATVGLARMGIGGLRGMLGGGAAAAAATGVAARSTLGAGLATPLALGAGGAAIGFGHEVVAGGAAFGAARGAFRGIGPMGGASAGGVGRAALGGAARVAAPLAVGAIGYEAATGGFYSELRRRGNDKITSTLGAAGGGLMDFLSFGAYGRAFRNRHPSEASTGPNPNRRMVTIADAGFDSPGGAFERISNRLSLVEGNEAGGKDSTTLLQDIKDFLERTFGKGKSPPPPALQ